MTDWKQHASELARIGAEMDSPRDRALLAAKALCERMARGELVECSGWVAQQLATPAVRAEYDRLVAAEAPPPTEDERAHCERVAREMCTDETDETYEHMCFRYILRERAAVRAECQAEIARLRARVQELQEAQVGICNAEVEQ